MHCCAQEVGEGCPFSILSYQRDMAMQVVAASQPLPLPAHKTLSLQCMGFEAHSALEAPQDHFDEK